MKHPFSANRLLCTISNVQGVVLAMWVKLKEHCTNAVSSMAGKIKNSAILTHINDCDGVKHIKNLMSINTALFADVITPDHRDININIVKNNVQVIDSHKSWNVLLYKEALKIKELKPLSNNGLKVSKELYLFSHYFN